MLGVFGDYFGFFPIILWAVLGRRGIDVPWIISRGRLLNGFCISVPPQRSALFCNTAEQMTSRGVTYLTLAFVRHKLKKTGLDNHQVGVLPTR